MVTAARLGAPPGTSLKSLVTGFVLTKQTEGKSPRTVEFYSKNLKRFLWYVQRQEWPDDIRMLTEWHIRAFLNYVANETNRWGLEGNGSETAQHKVTHTTVHHYFVVLATFFGWVVREGFLSKEKGRKILKVQNLSKHYNKEVIKFLRNMEKELEMGAMH